MSKYVCTECSYEGDEPICPHCNIACESLEVDDDGQAKSTQEKYPDDLIVDDVDITPDEEL